MADSKGGRPPISETEIRDIVSKLEPYLKSGLNISKSLSEAQISRSTFYRLMDENVEFRDRINQFRNFVSILFNNIIVNELMTISAKQNPEGGKPRKDLTREDKDFLWKFGATSNLTKEEFGRKDNSSQFDPEVEIHRIEEMIKQHATEEIHHPEETEENLHN